uniref:Uncharacterized protein n=1 Tax=Cacopsylla melanoneura TaxID=428564 RepID=A0A8D9C134_9HEMI
MIYSLQKKSPKRITIKFVIKKIKIDRLTSTSNGISCFKQILLLLETCSNLFSFLEGIRKKKVITGASRILNVINGMYFKIYDVLCLGRGPCGALCIIILQPFLP